MKESELLLGLLVVAHLVGALVADFELLLADDETPDVLRDVLQAWLEDRNVDLLVRAVDLHFEVGLHVVD